MLTIVTGIANKKINPRSDNQGLYITNINTHDLSFGIGPAGTGKTFLAVALGAQMLIQKKVERMIITRPAVEAGERLGFLPGDLSAKVDPYMRPIFDALYDTLGPIGTDKRLDDGVIEVAPLAFMRGRTLKNCVIILDEAQNTTKAQMKMFLTRIGDNTKTMVNGDVTQIDLPRWEDSGLLHVDKILQDIEGISFTYFTEKDVVRHPLVKRIISAYGREGAE